MAMEKKAFLYCASCKDMKIQEVEVDQNEEYVAKCSCGRFLKFPKEHPPFIEEHIATAISLSNKKSMPSAVPIPAAIEQPENVTWLTKVRRFLNV